VRSAVEHGPAFIVAQALVVEDEFPDLTGNLSALPLALAPTGRVALAVRRRRARSPDRVGRCNQFVGGHMRHRAGLAGGVCCFPRGAEQVSLAAALAWPAAVRAGVIMISPRAQARASSIVRRGRSSPGRACSK
jgi:hypothetical protein